MSLLDSIGRTVAKYLYSYLESDTLAALKKNADYYAGKQTKMLKVRAGKTDDNVTVNLVGLAVDRSISRLLAGGIEFAVPEEQQQEYLDDVFEVNKHNLLFYNAALLAAIYGTGYWKIVPDGVTDPYTLNVYPRLVTPCPEWVTIEVDPQDAERVMKYVIRYSVDGTEYLEITRRATAEDFSQEAMAETWIIEYWQAVQSRAPELINMINWPYDFPNIVHWKNLPSVKSIYGSSDVDDIIDLQDKTNFVISNMQKISRLQGYKIPWGKGVGKTDELDAGPDKFVRMNSPDAELGVLDFQSDIMGPLAFSHDLRQSLFDSSREVDITSMVDRIGALTNFGLRVLYSDSLAKVDTKRQLFGEGLLELNRRLLVMNGWEREVSRPGEIIWSDPLPTSLKEDLEADVTALGAGIVDRQTIYERYQARYGHDWDEIRTRLSNQQIEGENVGAAILRAFNRGQ